MHHNMFLTAVKDLLLTIIGLWAIVLAILLWGEPPFVIARKGWEWAWILFF